MIRLSYEILKDKEESICTIRLVGHVSPATAMTLECCTDRLKNKTFEQICLNCEELSGVDLRAAKSFARFQDDLRTSSKCLLIYFLEPELRTNLLKVGAVRSEECPADISQALQNEMIRNDMKTG